MSSSQWNEPHEINEIITKSSEAKSVEDVHKLCTQLCELLSFEQFLYGAQFPTCLTNSQVVVISAYSSEWFSHYEAMGYKKLDPIVLHCQNEILPLIWDQIDSSCPNQKARQIMHEARDFGLKSGFSVPVHGSKGEVALLSFSSSLEPAEAKDLILQALPYATFLSNFVHEAARRVLVHSDILVLRENLTAREKECLLWAAEGKTTWETAQILRITERTVNFHLQNATTKLNVSNRSHAVARAIAQHLIAPQLA